MEKGKFDFGTIDCEGPGRARRWIRWKIAFEIYASDRRINDQKQKMQCSASLWWHAVAGHLLYIGG